MCGYRTLKMQRAGLNKLDQVGERSQFGCQQENCQVVI